MTADPAFGPARTSEGGGGDGGGKDGGTDAVRFVGISLDCAEPAELAEFYRRLLGGRLVWSNEHSAGVQAPPGILLIAQRVSDHRPPAWPGSSIVHLDLTAGEPTDDDDLTGGDRLAGPERIAISLGARRAEPQPDPRWLVLLDPAGHPFCITTVTPSPELLA